jgi:choline dehydrogenase-like flavoprotein
LTPRQSRAKHPRLRRQLSLVPAVWCKVRCVTVDNRVVVIGSGPPGAAAAAFLSQAGVDVLVLEAGPERASLGLTVRVRGHTVLKYRRPLKHRDGVLATGDEKAALYEELSPGGLTNHWSCAVPRFCHDDFVDGARAGEVFTWPVGYDDLAPWYDALEPLLHTSGSATDVARLPAGKVRHARRLGPEWSALVEAAPERGRSLVPMPYAYGGETTLTLSGTVFNSFVRLIRPARRSGRLSVRFGARVMRLEWSREQRRVVAVILGDTRTGAENRVPCRAVVVAAGAVNTAQILLQSASGEFPAGLGNTHDVLGRYLHDHPLGKLIIDLGAPISIHPASYLTRPSLEHAPPLYAAACMQWCNTPFLARSVLQGHPGRLNWLGFSVFGAHPPTRDDWLAIDPARPRKGSQVPLTLHLRQPPEAREALEKARDDLVDVLRLGGLRPRVRAWNIEPVGESVHYGGTCRMHASPQFGMIDAWSRLHAVRNVVVGDSSAFTTGPEKNPVLTAMALAARASRRLAEEIKQGDL